MKAIPYDATYAEMVKLRQQNEDLKNFILQVAQQERETQYKLMRRGTEWRKRSR